MFSHCSAVVELCLYFFFRGLNPVPDKEVIAMYEGCHVPLENMSDFYGKVRSVNAPLYRKCRGYGDLCCI